jgi:hypothetical protein
MLFPNPSDLTSGVVLISGKPQLSLLAENVEDLALNVTKVWVARLATIIGDVELKQTCGEEKDLGRCLISFGRSWPGGARRIGHGKSRGEETRESMAASRAALTAAGV